MSLFQVGAVGLVGSLLATLSSSHVGSASAQALFQTPVVMHSKSTNVGRRRCGTNPCPFVVTVLIKHHVDIHIMTVNSIIFIKNDFKQ